MPNKLNRLSILKRHSHHLTLSKDGQTGFHWTVITGCLGKISASKLCLLRPGHTDTYDCRLGFLLYCFHPAEGALLSRDPWQPGWLTVASRPAEESLLSSSLCYSQMILANQESHFPYSSTSHVLSFSNPSQAYR